MGFRWPGCGYLFYNLEQAFTNGVSQMQCSNRGAAKGVKPTLD